MIARARTLCKRYAAFIAGIAVGAFLMQAPEIAKAFLALMWAFATNPTPERVAIIAAEIAIIWLVGKRLARAKAV